MEDSTAQSPKNGDEYATLLKAQYLRMQVQRDAGLQPPGFEEVKLRLFLALLRSPDSKDQAANGSEQSL